MSTDIEPWERQQGESSPAFQAWVAYRDMGDDRSHAKVARQLGKSSALVSRWASAKGWHQRILAWERHLDRQRVVEAARERREMRARHAQLGVALLTKVVERLAGTGDGRVTAIDPNELDAKDLARLAVVGSRLESEARQMSPTTYALNEQAEAALIEQVLAGDTRAIETWLLNRDPARWQDRHSAATAHAVSIAGAAASATGPLDAPALRALRDKIESQSARLAEAGRKGLPGSVVDTTATEDAPERLAR